MAKVDYHRMYETIFDNPDEEDEKYFVAAGRPIRALRLYNFATNHAEIQESHKVGLYEQIIRPMRGETNYWIQLIGYASKKGNAAYNRNLSLQRCNEVKKYILTGPNKLYVAEFRNSIGQGADLSPDAVTDDFGYWRSVKVYVHKGSPPPPPKPNPKPIEPPKKVVQNFSIKMMEGASISLFKALGRDAYVFQIRDTDKNTARCFHYLGTSLGLGGGMPLSLSGESDPVPFTATSDVALTVDDFDDVLINLKQEPGAAFGSDSIRGNFFVSFGARVDNRVFLLKMTEIKPDFIKISANMGLSLFAGVSISFGRLRLIDCPQSPYEA